jgi:hypothetical protein
VAACVLLVAYAAIVRSLRPGSQGDDVDRDGGASTGPSTGTQGASTADGNSDSGAQEEQIPAPDLDESEEVSSDEGMGPGVVGSHHPSDDGSSSGSDDQPEPPAASAGPRRSPAQSVGAPGSRAVEQAKTTRRPSEHPPSAGFPEPP